MMDLASLKEKVESGSAEDGVYVLSGNRFLAEQYAAAISHGDCYPVDDLARAAAAGSLDPDSWALCRCREYSPSPLPPGTKAIVLCDSAEGDSYAFPDPEAWQLEEYASSICPGVGREKVAWLCKACGGDPWRVRSECSKIALFPVGEQDGAFDMLSEGGAYSDLNPPDAMALSDAIVSGDPRRLAAALSGIGDAEPMALVGLLSKSISKAMAASMGGKRSAGECGMSDRQFAFFSRICRSRWSPRSLLRAHAFLSSYDSMLKAGMLPMSRRQAIDYVACQVAAS